MQWLEYILQELAVEIGELEKQKDELEDRLKKVLFFPSRLPLNTWIMALKNI